MIDKQPYPCRYTDSPVKLTGLLDDPAWKKAQSLVFYVAATGEAPISKTEGKILWDENYLYVGFKAYDKDIWSYFTQRDDPTCLEDVLEIFFKTNPNADPYFNFEINALGTIYDAFSLKGGAGGGDNHRWRRWDCEGAVVKIFIKGELNNPEVIDEYWQMEVAIPFAQLPTLKGNSPNAGDVWSFHLARYDYSIHLPEGVELSSCTRLSQVNFHNSADWLPLVFEK